jgi:p-methyltransferase
VLREELRSIRDAGVRWVYFIDDLFTLPEGRFRKILRMMIEEDFGFRWYCLSRATGLRADTIAMMAEAGCACVNAGMESGDPGVLANIDKRLDLCKAERQLATFGRHGIAVSCTYFVGFPGETDDSIANTLRFINSAHCDAVCLHFFTLGRGSLVDGPELRKRFRLRGEYRFWRHCTGNALQMSERLLYLSENIRDDILRVQDADEKVVLVQHGYRPGDLRALARLINPLYRLASSGLPAREAAKRSRTHLRAIAELDAKCRTPVRQAAKHVPVS